MLRNITRAIGKMIGFCFWKLRGDDDLLRRPIMLPSHNTNHLVRLGRRYVHIEEYTGGQQES